VSVHVSSCSVALRQQLLIAQFVLLHAVLGIQNLTKERRAESLEGRNDTLSEMVRGTSGGGEQMTDEEIQDQVRTSIFKK
jgi:hypothetical protein